MEEGSKDGATARAAKSNKVAKSQIKEKTKVKNKIILLIIIINNNN
jgi:hypothetical protein